MKTHTPGPWTFYPEERYIEGPREFLRPEHEHICDLRADLSGRLHEANARLIAAAPELLAALSAYQRLVGYLQRTTNPEEWAEHGDWKRLQAEADAAIRKAKGDA